MPEGEHCKQVQEVVAAWEQQRWKIPWRELAEREPLCDDEASRVLLTSF